MKKFAQIAAAACALITAPAVASPIITSIEIKNIDGIPGQGYLQIAELQLFGAGGTNYALTGTATATSVYVNGPAVPSNANDGNLANEYPSIYHGDASDGSDVFTLTLAAPTAIDRVSIFGRYAGPGNCCTFRDLYSFTTFNGSQKVASGTLDARGTAFATTALPEPATWAMMLLGFGMIGFGLRARRTMAKVNFA